MFHIKLKHKKYVTGIHIFRNIHKSQYNRKPREEVRKIKN